MKEYLSLSEILNLFRAGDIATIIFVVVEVVAILLLIFVFLYALMKRGDLF